MSNRKATELDYFYAALMFYTRIPVPSTALHSQTVLDRSRKYFPLIGIIIGSIAAATFVIANQFFGTALSIALSMALSLLATGAFHEDGLADSFDGFGGGWTKEQVLTIMKDSRLGTYGAAALILILGIKFLSLLEIAANNKQLFFLTTCVAAHTLSRTLSSSMIDLFDYVQDIDNSKIKPITEKGLSANDRLASFAITAVPILLLGSLAPAATVFACLACCVIALTFMAYSRSRIGGYTGDVLGAIQQLSELTFYLSLAAAL
jgi:adenosylcobinamide-GDP ribazoletransferase